jgi:hypothetical protein
VAARPAAASPKDLSGEGRVQLRYDTVLHLLRQVRVKGEGQDLLVGLLGDRTHTSLVSLVCERRVKVHWQIVNLHTDAVRSHLVEHFASPTVPDPDHVEVPSMVGAGEGYRQFDSFDRREQLAVSAG